MRRNSDKVTKKAKKEGAAYMTAHEVAALCQRVARENPEHQAVLDTRVLYVYTRKPQTVRGGKVPFTVTKLGGLGSFFAMPETKEHEWCEPLAQFLVVVYRDAWLLMPEKAQEACAYKILCAMDVETLDSGGKRLRLVKPDVEEYTAVIAKYGQNWLPSGVMAIAMSGQPEMDFEGDEPVPGPEPRKKKEKPPIHENDYNEGRLGGIAGAGA